MNKSGPGVLLHDAKRNGIHRQLIYLSCPRCENGARCYTGRQVSLPDYYLISAKWQKLIIVAGFLVCLVLLSLFSSGAKVQQAEQHPRLHWHPRQFNTLLQHVTLALPDHEVETVHGLTPSSQLIQINAGLSKFMS